MNKVLVFTAVMFIVTTSFVSAQAPIFGGDKRPSYFELDEYNHRYPDLRSGDQRQCYRSPKLAWSRSQHKPTIGLPRHRCSSL